MPDEKKTIVRGAGRVRNVLLLLAGAVLLGWLLFFDSHSLVERVRLHREHHRLEAENARLEADIQALEERLEAAGSPEVVEKIAREQYGMRRPGETVYRVDRK